MPRRHFSLRALGALLLTACGSRTGVDALLLGGSGGGGGNSGPDGGAGGFSDGGGGPTPPFDAGRVPAFSCDSQFGVQPGAPWPVMGRCPDRTGSTPVVGPSRAPLPAWSVPAALGDRVTGSVVVDAEGTVYAGGQAISPDGVVRWSLPPLDGLGGAGIDMAIGRSGTVYVSSESSGVEALRPDGTVLWSWSGNGGLVALGDDETVYLHPFEQSGFGLAAFSPDGHMLWTKVHPEWFDGAVAVALSGTLYAQHTLPMLSGLGALSPSGASLWVMPSPDWTSSFGPLYPVVAADQVLFVSGASVIAVDPAGQTRWSVSMAEPSIPPAVGVDGMVYVTDRQGSALHAIAADGTVRWTYDTQGRAGTTPILVDGAGTAYLGLAPSTGRVPPFDTVAITRQGTLAWTVPGGGSPLAIGADGTIYTDTGGSLTALRAR